MRSAAVRKHMQEVADERRAENRRQRKEAERLEKEAERRRMEE